jgi:integrase
VASLVLRGNTWHLMWRWRGRQKSRSTKVPHDGKFRNGDPVPPAAAKRELRKLETGLDQGHTYETKSLSNLLDLVTKEYEISGYRSQASLKSRLAHLREWFGNLRADRINETDFLEYADFRQKADAANNTINRELEVLMKALRLGKISPLPILKKLPAAKPRQGFFDDAKIAALCRQLPEYLRPPAMFGFMTGWRREEVYSLEWQNVDFSSGEIRLWESKTDEPRVFPMDVVPGLRPLLQACKQSQEVRKMITPFVFARWLIKSKRFRRITEFRKAWATACRKAGCPGMLFHDMRRSAARNLELAGWPRSLVMSWMGHETEAMYHRYRIVSAADREIVSKVLEKRKLEGSN